MTITLTAFAASPDQGRGLARDMPVRWALEELGLPYEVRPLLMAATKEPAHRTRHPFGQIPTLELDGLVLFESGAIVLHLAQAHPGLLPGDPAARARALSWVFAALSTIEPPILDLSTARIHERDRLWAAERLPLVEERLHARLRDLSDRLGRADWLDGAFHAGDLMVVSVLRRLGPSGLLDRHPTVAAYVARGEARPAFGRAFAAQRAAWEDGPRTP